MGCNLRQGAAADKNLPGPKGDSSKLTERHPRRTDKRLRRADACPLFCPVGAVLAASRVIA